MPFQVLKSLSIIILLCLVSLTPAQDLPPGFTAENIAGSATFSVPTGFAVAPDGRIFVNEKRGHIYVVENGIKLSIPFLDISDEVLDHWDRGLLGMALDPDFANNGHVYLLYTVDYNSTSDAARTDAFGRLTRYTASVENPNMADTSSRKVLIGAGFADGIPSCYFSHAPGTLRFGSDGTLLISNGDAANFELVDPGGQYDNCFGTPDGLEWIEDVGAFRSQFLGSMAGKVLRVDPETGLGLPSNPFYDGDSASHASRVWVYGLRNPFRFSVRDDGSSNPEDGMPGTLFIGDVGWVTWEEINVTHFGGENFGWPCEEGPGPLDSYQNASPDHSDCSTASEGTLPALYWHHVSSGDSDPPGLVAASITAGPVYEGSKYPEEYRDKLFMADFINGWMGYAELDENNELVSLSVFSDDIGSVVDIQYDPVSEYIYYVDIWEGRVNRLHHDGSVNIADDGAALPLSPKLFDNYPNPFNPSTTIRYELPAAGHTDITVFNLSGQPVKTLVSATQPAGQHQVTWDGNDTAGKPVASGLYLYHLKSGQYQIIKRMTLTR